MKSVSPLLWVLILLYSMPASALDFSNAWFQPRLEMNESEICQKLEHYTVGAWQGAPSGNSRDFFKILPLDNEQNQTVEVKNKEIYLASRHRIGCGGACNSTEVFASTKPFPEKDSPLFNSHTSSKISGQVGSNLLVSSGNMVFILNKTSEHDSLFELSEQAEWKKVCAVAKTPSQNQIAKTNGDVERMQESLGEFLELLGEIRQGAGNCGTLGSHRRRGLWVYEDVKRLLYSPPHKADRNYQKYEKSLEKMELWSLQGISEFKSFNQYQEKFEKVLDELGKFYQLHFKWEKSIAESAANLSLKSAISVGFAFNTYNPYKTQEEIALRRAILSYKPMEEIQKIDVESIEKSPKNTEWGNDIDSVLNVAVNYPEALEYLLDSGFDPNHKNVFHKTPLMYAAQHNNLESVRKLIEFGAEVNMGTTIPMDTCKYVLKTSNMSPLHYAVRYSEKSIIDLLVTHGASKFGSVSNRMSHPSTIEYPIDWLSRFENPNLTEQDKQNVKELIKLPSKKEIQRLTKKLNIQGESLYREGSYKQALDKFFKATEVDANNVRAMNNYALTLLKLGDYERSLEVSTQVIGNSSASDKQKSSAYFNSGLACDSTSKRSVFYNGLRYCRESTIALYLQAFKKYPTKSIANAIVDRASVKKFDHEHTCYIGGENLESVVVLEHRKLFFLHKQPMNELTGDIEFYSKDRKSKVVSKVPVTLKLQEMVGLNNGYFASLYKSGVRIRGDLKIPEGVCTSDSSDLVDEETYMSKLSQGF